MTSPSQSVIAAVRRAEEDALSTSLAGPDGVPRTLRVAMGDPQAPLEHVLSVLDSHGLLDDGGRLAPHVLLVSLGDHFDFGGAERAAEAERSGRLLLAWLSAHPPDQVVLIAGNHDLARVGELWSMDDETFAEARDAARALPDAPEAEASFLARYPALPSSEVAARDFVGFSVAQRELVAKLLRAGRFRVAFAAAERLLLCHAGVTASDLRTAGCEVERGTDAFAMARALDACLQRAVDAWREDAPLELPGLHTAGNASAGEGGGILYHRPSHPRCSGAEAFTGQRRRRYDPRNLPVGVVQVVGHVRDAKCRELLGEWVVGPAARDGELRHLLVNEHEVRYGASVPRLFMRLLEHGRAGVIFADGSMNATFMRRFELVDLDRLTPLAQQGPSR